MFQSSLNSIELFSIEIDEFFIRFRNFSEFSKSVLRIENVTKMVRQITVIIKFLNKKMNCLLPTPPEEEISTKSEREIEESLTSSEENKTKKKTSPQKVTRPSASKKYPGQIFLGIGKLGIQLLQFSEDPVDKMVIEIIWKDVLGKNGEEYKINTVEKVRSYFVATQEDDAIKKSIKMRFLALVVNFFSDKYYEFWLNNIYKGTQENKLWYQVNKIPLMDKILHNKKVHFYLNASSSPYECGNLTVNDSLGENQIEKKLKREENIEVNSLNTKIEA